MSIKDDKLADPKTPPTAPRAMKDKAKDKAKESTALVPVSSNGLVVSERMLMSMLRPYNQVSARPEVKFLPYHKVINMDVKSSRYLKAREVDSKRQRPGDGEGSGAATAAGLPSCDQCGPPHNRGYCAAVRHADDEVQKVLASETPSFASPRGLLIERRYLLAKIERHTLEMLYHHRARRAASASLKKWEQENDHGMSSRIAPRILN